VRLFALADADAVYTTAYIARDGHLVLKTAEGGVKFDAVQLVPRTWYHVALVHSRPRLKPPAATLYVDGLPVQTARLPYIIPPPGPGPGPADTRDVACIVGTPRQSKPSALRWRAGGIYVFDEALTPRAVNAMYFVGPAYVGNYQGSLRSYQTYEVISPRFLAAFSRQDLALFNLSGSHAELPSEASILVALHAANALDAHDHPPAVQGYIAAVVGPDADPQAVRNGTDVVGDARPAGVVAGSVRAYCGQSFGACLRQAGGAGVLVYLVQTAQTEAELAAALGLVNAGVRHEAYTTVHMEGLGYQMLAMALKRKARLLSPAMVDLLFALVGRDPARPECVE
jgi:hypothetical protein